MRLFMENRREINVTVDGSLIYRRQRRHRSCRVILNIVILSTSAIYETTGTRQRHVPFSSLPSVQLYRFLFVRLATEGLGESTRPFKPFSE